MPAAKRPAAAAMKATKPMKAPQVMKSAKASTPVPAKKKARVLSPVEAKLREVSETINRAEGLPDAVLQMLTKALENSVGIAKDERHEAQHEVVDMIAEVVKRVEDAAAAQAQAAAEKLEAAKAEVSRQESVFENAKLLAQEQEEAVTVARKAVKEAEAAESSAKAAVSLVEKEQRAGDKDLRAIEGKKASVEAMLTVEVEALKNNTAANQKKSVQMLLKCLKTYGADPQILTSAVPAFQRPATERGGFDVLVVKQIQDHLAKVVAGFQEQLDSGAAARADRAERLARASSEVEALGVRLVTLREEASAAEEVYDKALAQFQAEAVAVDKAQSSLQAASEADATAKDNLAARAAATAAFAELRERTSAQPEVAREDPAAGEA